MRLLVGALLLALGGRVAVADVSPRQVSAPVIRSVSMPPFILGAGGIRVVDASTLETIKAAPVALPSAETVLTRASVKAQLADFAALTSAIRGELLPTGVQLDTVEASSIFAAAGLRVGDRIVAVNGKPLRTLDDVAELYARAATATAASIDVVRDGTPLALRVLIR